ncbi:hypothetical protein DGG96_08330 [Legionella qingyii]|uniref:Uncharacterized protein n=1 Tax=Legionella qingyii TaxID=2184757 RepID=A0A317U6Y9_9GAMM|nr:hypothetical protein DGG96_08330 [Legionella qingyii]
MFKTVRGSEGYGNFATVFVHLMEVFSLVLKDQIYLENEKMSSPSADTLVVMGLETVIILIVQLIVSRTSIFQKATPVRVKPKVGLIRRLVQQAFRTDSSLLLKEDDVLKVEEGLNQARIVVVVGEINDVIILTVGLVIFLVLTLVHDSQV